MKEKVLGYKIRHQETGLFLSSLSASKWTKVGKTWPRKGDVSRAINYGFKKLENRQGLYDKAMDDMMNWEIVELTENNAFSALFLLDKIK